MAGFQSPPKRCGSLVVESGFPTSLVDLFVKNRDRLKRMSKKKSKREPQMEISRPMNVTPPPPCYSKPKVKSSSRGKENMRRNVRKSTPVEELVGSEECVGDDRGVRGDDGSKKRRFLMAVLRVFLVLILALWSKKLTSGITKAALLLLFLEFVATVSKARTAFDCFVEKVKVLWFCKFKKDEKEIRIFENDSTRVLSEGSGCDSSAEEIEVFDSECVVEDGDRPERGLELEKMKRILGEIEIKTEDKVDAYASKKERSRRAKMRANLKKFVSKKLYKKKDKKCKEKEEMNSDTEACYCTVEDELTEQSDGDNKPEQDGEEVSSRSSLKEEESSEGEEVFDEFQAEAKVIPAEACLGRGRKGNSGYLILCLIVLAGLFGGRVLALVLTVCWCLMLKLAGKFRFSTTSS